jgi:hypothetical protein
VALCHAAGVGHLDVAAQIEIDSNVRKQFNSFEIQALKTSAVNPGST